MSHQSSTGDLQRVQSLRALGLLDSENEERFDRITRLAAATFRMPIAVIALVDAERQWFKSSHGVTLQETPRAVAFCSHTIGSARAMVITDALLDERFAHSALVTGAPHVRFYAGMRICAADGQPVGTLCVMDRVPRLFGAEEEALLKDLASLVEDECQRGQIVRARHSAEEALQTLNGELETLVCERTRELTEKNDMLRREVRQRHSAESSLRQSEERIRTIIDSSFNAFIGLDARGVVIEWNPAAEALLGWKRDDAMGRELTTMIVPERYQIAHKTVISRPSRVRAGISTGRRMMVGWPVAR